ncbi:MAG: bifunctional 4-hydroxy-2-oxoglutarate aldolase/2-dehydro-3-deoxy-phosphogluconate aldolase [Chloroflexi bacterium]|nr:bifunctional 4-hydroxy-2-oxoglutarate aldolase/2-dehydro-3-deoxy-phosphogluconate aldolase [Chloroflexota bacterium]
MTVERPASRSGWPAQVIRSARLVAVMRRIEPQRRLIGLVEELAAAGVVAFEITLDSPTAVEDLEAVRRHLERAEAPFILGAGTVRSSTQLNQARDAGADYGVSPVLDETILEQAVQMQLPFIPGAYTPTEVDRAWRGGATFVKLFPASSAGPAHVREILAPLAEVELLVTGGVNGDNALSFLEAGAVAVGIGSALAKADSEARRSIVDRLKGD